MSLTYLSGDSVGKAKKGKAFQSLKKTLSQGASTVKNTAKTAQSKMPPKRSAAEKKQARQRTFKKVKKVGVAPARVAFLLAVNTNALKLATKLARTWNKPGGKADILNAWDKVGGDPNKLKQAIAKGSKSQISGDEIGSVAASLSTALPIILALIPLFKKHGTEGDPKEAQQLEEGLQQARKMLAEDSSIPEGEVSMPRNKDVGIVTDPAGNPVQDPKYNYADESKSGGYEGEIPPESAGKAAKGPDGFPQTPDGSTKASNWSPLGFFFMLCMYAGLYQFPLQNLIQSYCIVAMLCIPLALSRESLLQRLAYFISFGPMNFINRTLKRFSHA